MFVLLKKYKWIGIITILSMIFLSACQSNVPSNQTIDEENQRDDTVVTEDKVLVYTSFYPVYDFATKIGGDLVEVINLLPAGAEPHDYEPTARDIFDLNKANAFFYNGGNFETWIEKIVSAIENKELIIVNTSESIQFLSNEETGNEDEHTDEGHTDDEHKEDEHLGLDEDEHSEDEHAEDAHKEDDAHDDHEEIDPHIWLDPLLAKKQAEVVKNTFVQLDPNNKDTYEQNFAELVKEFDRLDAEFQEMANSASRSEFIVSHSAFGYLAHRYGLKQVPIAGLSPSIEPSQKRLQEIIRFAQEKEIKYIMFETLVSSKVAEVVREHLGAEALILHNLEGLTKEEISQGKDYFSVMRENLESLRIALNE
jgi:zinc transport system substrate-binding protein